MKGRKPAYLGLDVGGTGAKAGVFDREGRLLGFAQRGYTQATGEAGQAELPIEVIYQACRDASREAVNAAGAEILALSVSSQGQTFVSVDESGRPLHPAIIWYDSRAGEQARRMNETIRQSGSPDGRLDVSPVSTAPKILWLFENRPEVKNRARRFFLLPDYISHRLTGKAVFDPVIASTTGFYDESRGEYFQAALDAAGVESGQMSLVRQAGSRIGNILKGPAAEWALSEKTVMAVGTNDQLAGALGAGNCRPGIGSETTGTCLALITLAGVISRPLPPGLITGPFPIPGFRFVLAYCKTAGLVLEWFRRELAGGTALAELDRLAAGVPPGSRGVTVLPHFDGMISPTPDPGSRGVFFNLNLSHSRVDMYRAILESLAFSLRENLELTESQGLPLETLRSIGGGARSDLWLQIKADVCGRPIEVPVVREAAVLGAAMLAAAGYGEFESVPESSERLYHVKRVFEPNPANRGPYDRAYAKYKRLYHVLFPV
ncbi:MAG: FGGY-family carbohydrate kinase [Acidobacteriota bacterium]